MYKEATTFISDLVNSYAWDTAIVFIQTFGGCSNYATKQNYYSTEVDKYCNIYNMAAGYFEWLTETSNYYYSTSVYCCTYRGGLFNSDGEQERVYAGCRSEDSATSRIYTISFRPLLYVKS